VSRATVPGREWAQERRCDARRGMGSRGAWVSRPSHEWARERRSDGGACGGCGGVRDVSCARVGVTEPVWGLVQGRRRPGRASSGLLHGRRQVGIKCFVVMSTRRCRACSYRNDIDSSHILNLPAESRERRQLKMRVKCGNSLHRSTNGVGGGSSAPTFVPTPVCRRSPAGPFWHKLERP